MAYIQKRNGNYRVRYTIFENGIKKKKSKTFSRYIDAKDFCVKIENSLREHSYIEPLKILVDEYLLQWLENKKSSIASNTFKGYLVNIRHINENLGNIPLQKLNAVHIKSMYAHMGKRYSGTTILYCHRVLSNALKDAVTARLLSNNPCDFADTPKKRKFKASYYHPDEIKALLEASRDSHFYVAILLAVTRGLRRSEVLGLTWNDISLKDKYLDIKHNIFWENDIWRLEDLKTDNNKRRIPLSSNLNGCS